MSLMKVKANKTLHEAPPRGGSVVLPPLSGPSLDQATGLGLKPQKKKTKKELQIDAKIEKLLETYKKQDEERERKLR